MALDFVFSIATKIAEYAIEPVGRQLGYLIYYNSNIHALKTQLHKLDMEKVMVVELVDAATRNGERVLPDVQEWLTSADLISEESKKFFNDQVKENQKCFSRGFLCPDLVSRYRVSRKSSKKKLEVDELLGAGKFDRVSIRAPPPPASSIFAGNAEVFKSRASTFKAIMDALADDKVKVIGVYGMGGIGKTTMVKQVAKEAEQRKLTDEFSMAVVSQKQDVHKIQSDIAELLGLKLDVESEEARAGHLFKRMNQGKKILLILDDLWAPIDLTAVGIPRGGKYCKIVLTSRDVDVCKGMNCDRFFSIDVLHDNEAWSFFRSIAGAAVDAQDLHPIATKIVAKCAGLPIAILTVARALSGKSQHFWTDALHQLQNSTPKNIKGMHGNVFSLLEVSYRSLESDELRYCFLICCLFKEDVDILMECLVRYGLGLNLFEGVHNVEAARDRAHVLVDYLKARCLLMDGKARHSVTMHDVIRDFGLFLTSNGGGEHVFLVRGGAEIIEWPNSNTYDRCTAISLLSHQISELPEGLNCPKLKIFIFEHEYPSTELKIPSKCFQETKELRVLKMCYYSIPSIPPSIAFLMNLETLCLECCILGDLSQIGALKKLKVLSLARSMFVELPREIGLLKHLLILDLTGCEELKVVPRNLISSLTRLECLYLLNTFKQWSWGGGNANVRELNHLPHLNTLEMHVPDISLLPRDFLLFQNLERFRVCLGDFKTRFSGLHRDLDKMLVVPIEPDYNYNLPEGVKTLLERSEVLVVKFKGSPHPSTLTLSDLTEGGFTTLKYLEVKHNYSMKYLVDSSSPSRVTTGFFPLLEDLQLTELGLNQICSGDLPDGSFGELRELRLFHLPNLTNLWYTNESARYPRLVNLRYASFSDCKELKHAFPQSALGVLGQLWTLSFRNCNSLKGIYLEDSQHTTSDIILLPKLQGLWICRVPSLKSFCFQDNEAPTAEQQSHTKIHLPALENLDFEDVDQNIHIWLQQLLPESFLSLRVLRLCDCKSIVTALPSNVPHCLQNLSSLTIENCESLETILDEDSILRREDDCVGLVRELEVPREFPSLKTIFISDCPKLRTFAAAAAASASSRTEDSNDASNINATGLIPPFFDEKIAFPALEDLTLTGVDIPEEIWHQQLPPAQSFCSLRYVRIIGCNNLVTIFPSTLLSRLQNLRIIDIGSCDLLERVFDVDDTTPMFTLPSLQELFLSYLHYDLIHFVFSGQIVYPTLKFLRLEGLDDLKEIWHPQFLSRQSFNGLRTVTISHCNDLVTIFPSSVLRRLKNLDAIEIMDCELVEKVFDFDDEDAANVGVMMIPRLKYVNLKFLPKLVCFGHGAAEFPSLKKMEIRECPRMVTFMGTQEHNHGGMLIGPFFHEKVYMPVLEELTINGLQDSEELWHDQLQAESFNQLKVLEVNLCSKLSNIISLRLLLTMKNLDKISVGGCESVNDIVKIDSRVREDQDPLSDAMLTRSNLHELNLTELPKLVELWWNKDCSGVFSCPNLYSLDVCGCHGLRHIFVASAIKHDMNVKKLLIINCSNMEEVVREDRHEGCSRDKIVFRLTQSLSLRNLPNLRSFCGSNCILEWPSLSKMVMNNCPNMETFCWGPISTPQLKGLTQSDFFTEVLWEGGDLNSIIQHLFKIQRERNGADKKEEETATTQQTRFGVTETL